MSLLKILLGIMLSMDAHQFLVIILEMLSPLEHMPFIIVKELKAHI